MKLVSTLCLLLASNAAAFTAHRPAATPSLLRMSTEVEQEVPIILNGQNIELTPALIDHVNKRIGGPLKKLASNGAVTECDVVLSVNKNPKVSAIYHSVIRVDATRPSSHRGVVPHRSRTATAWKWSPT